MDLKQRKYLAGLNQTDPYKKVFEDFSVLGTNKSTSDPYQQVFNNFTVTGNNRSSYLSPFGNASNESTQWQSDVFKPSTNSDLRQGFMYMYNNPNAQYPQPTDTGYKYNLDKKLDWTTRSINNPTGPSNEALQSEYAANTENGITGNAGSGMSTDKPQAVEVKPTVAQKIAGVAGGVSSIGQNYISQQSQVANTGELMQNAGWINNNVGGVNYKEYNPITGNNELSNLDKSGISNTLSSTASGAAAGAMFGPWGAVAGGAVGLISGLFGWGSSKSKLRKRIYNAQQLANRLNTGARAGAMSTVLQNNYNSRYGGLDGGTLYANKGKDKWQKI